MERSQPPVIFSRRKAAAKWARGRSRSSDADAATYLSDTVTDDVIERLEFMRHEPGSALVVGDGSGRLAKWLKRRGTAVVRRDLGRFDEEQPGEPDRFDLVVHLMGLGHVNDLPGALIHARNSLAPGGVFIAAFPGAGSLATLRRIALAADGDRPSPRMHPLVDEQAGASLLQRAGFTRQVVDSFPVDVRFGSLRRLVEDLRDHGLTRSLASPAPPVTRRWLARAEDVFEAERDAQGKVPERFEILVLTAWKV
ncbi:methyltransferase domain-containing protein [Qipengyuania sp. JC766]|uniref:methyltransferase domain-containing protein n=1 Tax=Qipengyuania sp. JC766 TaxID=3232139 RepID=UPI003458DB2B